MVDTLTNGPQITNLIFKGRRRNSYGFQKTRGRGQTSHFDTSYPL